MKLMPIIYVFIPVFCIAQNDNSFYNNINKLEKVWKNYESLEYTQEDSLNSYLIQTLLSYPVQNNSSNSASKSEYYNLKSQYYKKDFGLSASANYLENLNPGPGDDDLIYNRRLQAGIYWDVLKGGWLANKNKSEQFQNLSSIEIYEDKFNNTKETYLSRWHSILFAFNKIKTQILDERLTIVEQQIEVANSLHESKLVSREDLISIYARKAEIESMYGIYNTYNTQLEPDFPVYVDDIKRITLLDLNYETLLGELSVNESISDSVKFYEQKNVDLENSVLHDISLKTFARYNWYDMTNGANGNRNFFSLGASVSVPIPFNNKIERQFLVLENDLKHREENNQNNTFQKDILNDAYEYRYKLKQFVNLIEKRAKFTELLRQERVKYKLDRLDFNPVKALNLVDDVLKIDIELTDLQQNMYLKILRIHEKLPKVNPSDLVKPIRLSEIRVKSHKIESVYAWSSALKRYKTEFIAEYFVYNNVQNAIISFNKDTSLNRAREELCLKLAQNNIKIEVLIGVNNLIKEENPETYLKSVVPLDTNLGTLHLDVEPHTFDDWKENKATYLVDYLSMLDKVIQYSDNKGLNTTVSIPLHYPENETKLIIDKADKTYFMAYENVKSDYIIKKVKPYLESPEKIVVCLRTDDFNSMNEVYTLIDKLKEGIGNVEFCIHDIESLYELHKKTLNEKH